MKKEIKEINVKELIDEIKTGEEEAKKKEVVKSAYTTRVEKKTKKYTPGYSVIFADGPDIAINKKTQQKHPYKTLSCSRAYAIYSCRSLLTFPFGMLKRILSSIIRDVFWMSSTYA